MSVRADGSDSARKRAIVRVVKEVAAYLGNTPAVARASYIDPRIISLYEDGETVAPVLGGWRGDVRGRAGDAGPGRAGRPGPAALGGLRLWDDREITPPRDLTIVHS